jgi:hypothetical protein
LFRAALDILRCPLIGEPQEPGHLPTQTSRFPYSDQRHGVIQARRENLTSVRADKLSHFGPFHNELDKVHLKFMSDLTSAVYF